MILHQRMYCFAVSSCSHSREKMILVVCMGHSRRYHFNGVASKQKKKRGGDSPTDTDNLNEYIVIKLISSEDVMDYVKGVYFPMSFNLCIPKHVTYVGELEIADLMIFMIDTASRIFVRIVIDSFDSLFK